VAINIPCSDVTLATGQGDMNMTVKLCVMNFAVGQTHELLE